MSSPPLPSTDDVLGPDTFARSGYPHAAWKRLRREAPVHWFDLPGGVGFWAITRREDVVWISKQPARFRNGPRLAIFERGAPVEGERTLARHLLNMDPPEHAAYRGAASGWFTPRAIQRRQPEVERIARDLLDAMAGDGGERTGDFVADLTAPLTLHVLADMLGVPRADWRLMFRWTNQIAGASDSEYQTGGEPIDGVQDARQGLFEYFTELAAERRKAPRDDMVSVLANASVGGRPMPAFELLSYFLLLVVAGNETTRNAASGGLLALIEHPEQMQKLRAEPALVPTAVEEIVRWTSPVIQFCRTPLADVEIRGQRIAAGESLCLLYPSANRDEDAFAEPDAFRVDRKPNPHLGFGIGEHFCLGANLARLELRVIFAELARRLEAVELAGPVERMRSSFLGGVKRMPIRYRLRAARAVAGLLAGLWVLTGAGAARADQLDQSFAGPGTVATVDVTESFARAQTFTVGLDGTLTRIAMPLAKSGNTLDADELRIDVRPTDAGGAPLEDPGSALAVATVLGSELTEALDPNSPVELDLSAAAVPVTAGQQLAIVWSSSVPWAANRGFALYAWIVSGEGYAGGAAWLDAGTWQLQNGGGVDLAFRTWVEAPEPAAGAGAGAAAAALAALARCGRRVREARPRR
jgi:cytochrome P450